MILGQRKTQMRLFEGVRYYYQLIFDRGSMLRSCFKNLKSKHLKYRAHSQGNKGTVSWKEACQKVPFCLSIDCKSLYDTCIKPASTTKENRVALDLLDVREGMEYFGGFLLVTC